MRRRGAAAAAVLALAAFLAPAAEASNFGVQNFDLGFTDAGGAAATQAGSHPFAVTSELVLNTEENANFGTIPAGALKDLVAELPEGLVGDPLAVPRCSSADFIDISFKTKIPDCSNDSAVGTILVGVYQAKTQPLSYVGAPVYDITPSPGEVQRLGFSVEGVPVAIGFRLSQRFPYRVQAELHYVAQPVPVFESELVIWGNPADHAHDEERGSCINAVGILSVRELSLTGNTCPVETGTAEKAFITLPRACRGPLETDYRVESWDQPPAVVSGAVRTHDSSEPPLEAGFEGCSALGFSPQVDTKPSTSAAESPSGLEFSLDVDDPGLTDPTQNAQSDIGKAVVTLPEGVTTNPAIAQGLGACTTAQYEAEAESLEAAPANGCPQSSKVGTVEIESPLVEPVINGSVFVAKQRENPFGNLLTLYMVAKSPELGVNIRAAGKVDPDPATGQLTTTFDNLPQLPFSHFRFHFREGQRSALITPPTCGHYTATADLYPYANPGAPLRQSAGFDITAGANGGGCATSEGGLPVTASFSAGTTSPIAGAYSPFVLRLTRPDGSQQISQIQTTLPEGLLGRLVGISYCPEAAIAQAASRTGEGEGATELAHPSCPAASEVGTVTVGAGAGTQPLYVQGKAYLAGPYKGAPVSLEIITPAIAGPFDLGTVAVRTALQVDLKSARITAVSDPIPTILHGLPLDVRSIAIDMSRPKFILNPTSCEPKEITGSVVSTLSQATPVSQYFQVEGCGKLKFKPSLVLHLKGPTRRSGHPALKAVLTYPKKGAYANVARAQVGLPHSEFLDQGNIGTVCTQPQLKSKTCPKKSIYGRAKAWSPLLEKPLSGPVYLGVGYGDKLPDLVADLGGQIRVLLNGRVDTDPQEGIRNTFEAVPDAPVSKFVLELWGGPKQGLLENSENICRKAQKASTKFVAQNGIVLSTQTPIGNECGGGKKKSSKKHNGKRHRH